MNSDNKPNFLSQPIVKNIFVYRNGDPYYEARRVVLNQKRVNNFETFLRDVTGGVQAPFGAVRNIYTPRCGHKVDSLDLLQSGEQYVAAGREKFKKLDYLHISSRKKPTLQSIATRTVPVRQSRLLVSARFLKPINEPCTVFIVANGDVLDPALRLLIPQRILGQFDRVLDLITERIGFRILGGVRSLYTFEGQQVTDGKLLENGQFFVACGREKFKKLPYQDLLFTKPRGVRRIAGSRATTLPPIYRFSKQNGNQSKSHARSSDSGESKTPPPPGEPVKEHLSSIVREISQARLISLRSKRSRMSMSLGYPDNEFADEADGQKPQDLASEEKPLPEENGKEEPEQETANGEKEVEEHTEEESSNNEEGRERLKQQAEEATVEEQHEEGGTVNEGKEEEEEEVTGEGKEEAIEEVKEEGEQEGKVEEEEVAKEEGKEEGKEEIKQEEEAGSVNGEETGEGDDSGQEEKLDDSSGGQSAEEGEKEEDGDGPEESGAPADTREEENKTQGESGVGGHAAGKGGDE